RLGGPGSLMSRTCIFPLWHRPAVLARAVGNSDALSTALSACAAGRSEASPAGHVVCNRKFSGVEETSRRRSPTTRAVVVSAGAGYIALQVVRLLTAREVYVPAVDDVWTGRTARVAGVHGVALDREGEAAAKRLSSGSEELSDDPITRFAAKEQV